MSGHNAPAKLSTWLLLAVASGTCAAINGVFAKLTTTALTTTWSHSLAHFLHLAPDNPFVNFLLRALFFGLNIAFNILMWTLFTAALTRASSTTRVSIINVSANFMVTALLGAAVFGEKLNGTWWVGAGLLAAGNVVIGRREGADAESAAAEAKRKKKKTATTAAQEGGVVPGGLVVEAVRAGSLDSERDALLSDTGAGEGSGEGEEVADIIDLGDEDLLGKVGKG